MPAAAMRDLNHLLARAEENVAQTQRSAADAVQTLRDIKSEIARERGRRSHLTVLALVPVGLGSAAIAARWLAANRAVIASTAGGVATGAAASVIAIAALTGPGVVRDEPAPTPTYGALPPPIRTPPPGGPSKVTRPAGTPAEPTPSPTRSGGGAASPPTTPPPATSPPVEPPPIDSDAPVTTEQQCRIYLPKLNICLLPLLPRS